jgi:hypothetical protein
VFRAASSAKLVPISVPDPPKNVTVLVFPVVVVVVVVVVVRMRAMKASIAPPGPSLFCTGAAQLEESPVNPVTRTFPLEVPASATMSRPASLAVPPRYVK